MGPNSGGGKRNKTKATPARARFSNFCPKNSGKEPEGRGRDKTKRSVPKSGISASVAGAFDQVSHSLLAGADLFQLSPQVADHVMSLLSRSIESDSNSSSPSSESEDAIESTAAPAEAPEKHPESGLDLLLSRDVVVESSRYGLSDSENCALQLFAAHGFTKEDFVNLSDIVGDDLIDICTAAVLRICDIRITSLEQRRCPSTALEEELISLGSIYGDNFSTQRSSNGCILSQLAYEASGAFAILAIQLSDMYPSEKSNVAVWFSCPSLSRSSCLAVCRGTMGRVHQSCVSGCPVMFDVFQSLEEASLSPPPVVAENRIELQKIYDKYKYWQHPVEQTVDMFKQASVEVSVVPEAESKLRPEPAAISASSVDGSASMSSETIQSIRIQYNKALNWADESGFSPLVAPQKAKERLCSMFPQHAESLILAVISGKSSHLVKPSIAFNIRDFDFGLQLQCTKSIMKSIDVTKGKAKSLLAQAQQHVVEDGGKIFACDIDEAKQLWVDLSISLYEEQNLVRRKQQAESYQARRGLMSKSFSNANTDVPASDDVTAKSAKSVNAGAASNVTPPASQHKVDLAVAQVSKLFSEQQCVDAVRSHSNRLQKQTMPAAKTESDVRRDMQVAERLCTELRAKFQSDRYKRMLAVREQLPAFQQQENIVSVIRSNRVTLVVGDTGCGKTTQIPQFVLDSEILAGRGSTTNIIITQPRRIAAVSVAERIAQERAEEVGATVGYHIKLEKKASPHRTRCLLMTTGVLLRKIQLEGFVGVSHLFIDEVHERDVNTDFLLILVKHLLKEHPTFKVVLMSATLNAKIFSDYFREFGCSSIVIPGRTFPVTAFFLEDVLALTGFQPEAGSDCVVKSKPFRKTDEQAGGQSEAQKRAVWAKRITTTLSGTYAPSVIQTLLTIDESVVNTALIAQLVSCICSGSSPGAVLVFVPGIAEIREIVDILSETLNPHTARVLPLHSSLSTVEQQRVFEVPPSTLRKIVVATNIAETSITIPDVVFVIDTGRTKESRFDEKTQYNTLQDDFASQSSAMQRRGRAGRVRSGTCYCLLSRCSFESLPLHSQPELLRISLEEVCLNVLALQLGDPLAFLSNALTPPTDSAVINSLNVLANLNAALDSGPEHSLERWSITPLGYHLAALPVNPRIGKLILYGILFSCVDPVLTIAASLEKSPFVTPFEKRDQADEAKSRFCDEVGAQCDLLAVLPVWRLWKAAAQDHRPERFCYDNFLSHSTLNTMEQSRRQFFGLIQNIGFIPSSVRYEQSESAPFNKNKSNVELIRCILVASFSPNVVCVPREKRGPGSSCCVLSTRVGDLDFVSSKGNVHVHPSSSLFASGHLDSPYGVFYEAVLTKRIYLRDLNTATPPMLLLFCSSLKVWESSLLMVADGWLAFKSNAKTISAIISIRGSFDRALTNLVLDPAMADSKSWNTTMAAIESVLVGRPIFPNEEDSRSQQVRVIKSQNQIPQSLFQNSHSKSLGVSHPPEMAKIVGMAACGDDTVALSPHTSAKGTQFAMQHHLPSEIQPKSRKPNFQKAERIIASQSLLSSFNEPQARSQQQHYSALNSVDGTAVDTDKDLRHCHQRPQSSSVHSIEHTSGQMNRAKPLIQELSTNTRGGGSSGGQALPTTSVFGHVITGTVQGRGAGGVRGRGGSGSLKRGGYAVTSQPE